MNEVQELNLDEQTEILRRRKQAILKLIEEMTDSLPQMAKVMLSTYRGLVTQFVDCLTFEQSEELINRVQNIIDELRG